MTKIGRRIVGAVPVLFGISLIVFMLMHLAPGDPVVLLLGDDATPADVARLRHDWGLDQPLLVQYWQFISRAMVGDFGKSLKFGEPVLTLISERLPGDHRTCIREPASGDFDFHSYRRLFSDQT